MPLWYAEWDVPARLPFQLYFFCEVQRPCLTLKATLHWWLPDGDNVAAPACHLCTRATRSRYHLGAVNSENPPETTTGHLSDSLMGRLLSSEKECGEGSRDAIFSVRSTSANSIKCPESGYFILRDCCDGKLPRCLQPGKGILLKGSWELPLVSQL